MTPAGDYILQQGGGVAASWMIDGCLEKPTSIDLQLPAAPVDDLRLLLTPSPALGTISCEVIGMLQGAKSSDLLQSALEICCSSVITAWASSLPSSCLLCLSLPPMQCISIGLMHSLQNFLANSYIYLGKHSPIAVKICLYSL